MGRSNIPENLCVKIYNGDLFRNHSTEITKSIDREYQALQEIDNPYIVRLIAMFKDIDEYGELANVHLVLEKALPPSDGPKLINRPLEDRQKYGGTGELFRYLVGRGTTTEGIARFIMFQLLAAVQCLHGKKPDPIVHRDLKTENAVVFGELSTSAGLVPRIKLTDFGTARHIPVQALIMDKAILTAEQGSPQYIAPELIIPVMNNNNKTTTSSTTLSSSSSQSNNNRRYIYNENVDIYSLGVTMFFIITFQYPYADNTGPENNSWRDNLINGNIQWHLIDSLLSSSGKDLLRWMLQKNPTLRFSAEQCLSHRWFDPIREEVAVVFRDDTLRRYRRARM